MQITWLTFVQTLAPNRQVLGSNGDLAQFLFGSERAGLQAIVEGLGDLQQGRCFYCGEAMQQGDLAVDHFIAWSRYPRDLGHNFVLTHGPCNRHKRDMRAAPVHLERWMSRTRDHQARLEDIFDTARFISDAEVSRSLTQWCYDNAERSGALVWVRGRNTCHLSADWRRSVGA